MMKNLLVFFSAGCLGGLVNSLVVWQFGYQGIPQSYGVAIAPALTPAWLYPRIVWGGIWGLLFVLPMLRSQYFLRSLILSLFPSAVQLFVVFPLLQNKGLAGLELGTLTPLFVLFFNWVWALVVAYTIKFAR